MMASRPTVDFFISNDRHHVAMCRPVIEALADGCRCRILSLCEIRGLVSPAAERLPAGAAMRRLVPVRIRRSPSSGPARRPGRAGLARRALRRLAWVTLLAPRLRRLLRSPPRLAVLPNDAAFPYDRIARLLDRLGIPFLLLQEGIRFPLPGQPDEPDYGAGGAAAIAAWGEASAGYFRQVGAPEARVHLTGSPRFDHLAELAAGEQKRQARSRLGLPERTLLLLSNPIDDLGFCSRPEKMALIARFLEQVEPLHQDPDFHLAIKLHGRERPQEFRALVDRAEPRRISLFTDTALWDLLVAAQAAVVLASTVGLEALLCGLPLAVLEIPGHGFQYDYVRSQAAVGLSWDRPMASQIESLFRPSEERRLRVERYLQRQFAVRGQASGRVAELISSLTAEG